MPRLKPASLDLPTLASLAGAALSEHILQRLRAAGHVGVRASHGYVFQLLIDGPKSVGELSKLLGVTQQATSKAVLELEGLGYVAREDTSADNRVKLVALTAKSRAVIDLARATRAKLEAKVATKIGERAIADARLAMLAILELVGDLGAVANRRVKLPSGDALALVPARRTSGRARSRR